MLPLDLDFSTTDIINARMFPFNLQTLPRDILLLQNILNVLINKVFFVGYALGALLDLLIA